MWITSLGAAGTARAQQDFSVLEALWRGGHFQEAADALLRFRERDGVRSWYLDYMIATACCRADRVPVGRAYLLDLRSRTMDPWNIGLVASELERCPPQSPLEPAQPTGTVTASASVITKLFITGDEPFRPSGHELVRVEREVPFEVLRGRLRPIGSEGLEMDSLRAWTGNEIAVHVDSGFSVVSAAGHSPDQLKDIARSLEQFRAFFRGHYRMRLPDHMVTAFLARDPGELAAIAGRLHGLRMPEEAIGYSVDGDQTIVAVIPRMYIGTLAHELFHLMMRRDFGDAPAWLHEGMAALYEESTWQGDSLVGVPGWRGEVLARLRSVTPSLDELVHMQANDFIDPRDPERHAATIALARYFMMYLQHEGVLPEFYRLMRGRRVEEIGGRRGEDTVGLILTLLGRSIREVQRDFDGWFETTID